MDSSKVDMYMASNSKFFPPEKLVLVREKLLSADDSKYMVLSGVSLKDPTMMLVVSLLVGGLGVDRFMLEDIGMGVLKLLTGGVCGILTIVDWCTIMKKAREYNYNAVMMLL